jgi:hypothetical protein
MSPSIVGDGCEGDLAGRLIALFDSLCVTADYLNAA